MGKDDGGLVSKQMDDLEYWNYFKGDNMARGALFDLEESDEEDGMESWNFYYAWLREYGLGFSPKTKCPEQIIQADGDEAFYFSHDTFSKFLFNCIYGTVADQIWYRSTKCEHPIYELPHEYQGIHCIWMSVKCPREWLIPKFDLLVHFLKEVEHSCSIEECWFSSQKELHLFDTNDVVTEIPYRFARYVGCHSTVNLTVHMYFERCCDDTTTIRVWIASQDGGCTKQLVDEILKRTVLIKNAFTIKYMD